VAMRGSREDEGALASSWWEEEEALVIFSFLEVNNNVTHLPYLAKSIIA